MNRKGFSLVELLVYLFIISIVLLMGVKGFKKYRLEAEISNGVRLVVSSLNTARYEAVSEYERIRVYQNNDKILLQKKKDGKWKKFHDFKIKGNISIKFNNYPVFSPLGSASPLCSVIISNDFKSFKTSLSMAGRIKTTELK
jgi:prepilin-type N-terminal cleavage/methylation domain-containing protein